MRRNVQILHFEAMAYALGAIFLLTINSNFVLHIFGWVFIAFAILLIAESFLANPISWVDHKLLSLPLFVVTTAEFIIESVNSYQSLYIVLAAIFLVFLIIAILFSVFR